MFFGTRLCSLHQPLAFSSLSSVLIALVLIKCRYHRASFFLSRFPFHFMFVFVLSYFKLFVFPCFVRSHFLCALFLLILNSLITSVASTKAFFHARGHSESCVGFSNHALKSLYVCSGGNLHTSSCFLNCFGLDLVVFLTKCATLSLSLCYSFVWCILVYSHAVLRWSLLAWLQIPPNHNLVESCPLH